MTPWGSSERHRQEGGRPVLATMQPAAFDAGWDETFAPGLRHLLDGVAVDVAHRSPPDRTS